MIFVISNSDGDTSVRMMNEIKFLDALNSGYYGDQEVQFLTADQLQKHYDTNEWPGDAILVIQGVISTPKPIKVVKEYEL